MTSEARCTGFRCRAEFGKGKRLRDPVIERERPTSAQPKGALVLIGAWSEVDDHDADALLEEIYARRSEDTGRPVLTVSEPRTDTAC